MFFASCDPDRENLSLYSNADGSWVVSLPAEEVPPELPEPALGINFARDGMKRGDWLALVAVHSDAWLMAVAFYYSAKFTADQRKKLFDLINTLPTTYEVLSGKGGKKMKVSVIVTTRRWSVGIGLVSYRLVFCLLLFFRAKLSLSSVVSIFFFVEREQRLLAFSASHVNKQGTRNRIYFFLSCAHHAFSDSLYFKGGYRSEQ